MSGIKKTRSLAISVVFDSPDLNARSLLTLEGLEAQTHRNLEIVVVGHPGSTDSCSLGAFDGRINHVTTEHGSSAQRLNYGAMHALGEVLAFLGDGYVPFEDWGAVLSDQFQDSAIWAAGGPPFATTSPTQVSYRNCAFRTANFLELGGFDGKLGKYSVAGDLCQRMARAGGVVQCAPQLMVCDAPPLLVAGVGEVEQRDASRQSSRRIADGLVEAGLEAKYGKRTPGQPSTQDAISVQPPLSPIARGSAQFLRFPSNRRRKFRAVILDAAPTGQMAPDTERFDATYVIWPTPDQQMIEPRSTAQGLTWYRSIAVADRRLASMSGVVARRILITEAALLHEIRMIGRRCAGLQVDDQRKTPLWPLPRMVPMSTVELRQVVAELVRSSESARSSDPHEIAELLLDHRQFPTPIRHRMAVALAAGGEQLLTEATTLLLGRSPSDDEIVAYAPFLSTRAGCEQLLKNLFTSSSVCDRIDQPEWVDHLGDDGLVDLAGEGLVSRLLAQLEGTDRVQPEDLFRVVLGRNPSTVELAEGNERSDRGVQALRYVRWLASSEEASMPKTDAWPPPLGKRALDLVDAVDRTGEPLS